MGNSVRGGTGRWCPGGRATTTQRAAGRGLHPSAVTAVRPCGEAAGARARSLLDLGPVAPGALRADWPTGPEEVGRFRRADAAAGFGGRLRRLGQFQFLNPGGVGRALRILAASRLAVPFGRRHKMAAPGGGAMARVCGARGLRPGAEVEPLPLSGPSGLSGDLRGLAGVSARHT